jgi:hypothetical protein
LSLEITMRPVTLLIIGIALTLSAACGVRQKSYGSAEEATQALLAAVKDGKTRGLLEVLGPDTKDLVESGDPVQDENARDEFLKQYDTSHSLASDAEGRMVLQVGTDPWPFPFPLVEENGKWRFDSSGGVEEVINRRVGANELYTIQACLAYVDAQREYYLRNPNGDPLLHYARHLLSSEGKRDGLYFEVRGDEPESPLGAAFARARDEGYLKEGAARPEPYHGYVYRLLTSQGANAPGGAYDYVVRDQMLGGFAVIAHPADYGNSGVMTFIVSHDGVVFSKDLGPDTAEAAGAITQYDPDGSWKREAAI